MQRMTFDLAPKIRPCLQGQPRVALDDLKPGEQLVVQALRAARGSGPAVADVDGRRAIVAAIDGFAAELGACPPADAANVDASTVDGTEALTLHAIACMQSGLLGEAWKALRHICPSRPVDRALLRLDEAAHALTCVGERLARWRFDGLVVAAG